MKITYSYKQRAIVDCSGTMEVPGEVIASGAEAVHEYIRTNEMNARNTHIEIMNFNEEVEGSMKYEESTL